MRLRWIGSTSIRPWPLGSPILVARGPNVSEAGEFVVPQDAGHVHAYVTATVGDLDLPVIEGIGGSYLYLVDRAAAKTLYEEVRRRADDGLACVLVSHNLPAAEAICDRVWLVSGGIRREIVPDAKRPVPSGPLLDAWTQELR